MQVLDKKSKFRIEQICNGNGKGGNGCNCRLLVERDDIYVTHNYNYIYDEEPHFTFRCPICKQETDILEHLLPENVKSSLINSDSFSLKLRR